MPVCHCSGGGNNGHKEKYRCILWKCFYSLTPIVVVSTKWIYPRVLEFVVSNIREKLYSVWFLLSWFKWTAKSRTSQISVIAAVVVTMVTKKNIGGM
jgi:hypothetical protein